MNITDVIRRNSHAFPERVALVCNGQSLTYDGLRTVVDQVATQMALAGVQAGESVGVAVENPAGYLVTALALAHLGAVVTPFRAARVLALRQALVARHALKSVVLDPDSTALLQEHPALRPLHQTALFAPLPAGTPVVPVARGVDGQPWIIALSSGTTGVPKSIPQRHDRGALVATLPAGQTFAQRLLVHFDLSTSVGMNSTVRQLYAGGTVVVGDIRNDFFNVVRRDRPDQALMSTGNALALVKLAERAVPDSGEACASLQRIMLSGSAVSPDLRQSLVDRICSNVHVSYGSTEAGGIATLTPEASAWPGCAGRLNPWVEAEAVDENDQPLASGQVGTLRFKTPTMVDGYLLDEKASARAFRGGWYYSGDVGSVNNAGYLFLAGRQDDLINLGGNKLDPVGIEAVINALPGVIESAVVAVVAANDRPTLVAVVAAREPVDPKVIRQACLDQLGRQAVPQAVVFAPALPRNGGGKIMRPEAAEMARRAMSAKPAAQGASA